MVTSARPLIELRGIRRRYGGAGTEQPEVEVLRGIDLQIHAGEFVAIVGQSGSGKSTLMHLIGCLDRPSAGSYLFDGRDVASMDADELAWLRREAFGFVFQDYHLIASESASENVQVPALYAGVAIDERMRRAEALLGRLGMADRLAHRPNQLSGGQQQRVSIARALMNGGRIILADEPTGALDSRSGAEVMALLKELAAAGHTIILITHDAGVAAQAGRVIEIHDGLIAADSGAGTPAEVPAATAAGATDVSADANAAAGAAVGATVGAVGRDGQGAAAGLREAARSAWRGMSSHRTRTALTLLGIVIGVASVIVMLAVGEGARQKVMTQMGTMGTTIMFLGSRVPPGGGPLGELSDADLEAAAALPGVRTVMPVIGDPITVRHGNVSRNTYVFAAADAMPVVHHWQVAQGRYFTDAEDRALAPLVVLGHKAHGAFFPGIKDPIGRHLLIGTSPFEVIGVMTERGADTASQSYDDMVFIPYQSGRARVYQAQTQPDYVVVDATASETVLETEAALRRLLLERHGGREDFAIGNAAARLQAEAATRQSMTVMLGLIAAVSLVVGGIGVMNVMLMAVRERRGEIGIRLATGARQRDILRQFLTESVLVTLVGGTAGVVIGLAIGVVLILLQVPVVFSGRAAIGAFACAVATGVLFGYVPARTAARLDPVVALGGH